VATDISGTVQFRLGETLAAIERATTNFEIFKQLKATGIAYELPNFLVALSPGDRRQHFSRRVILTNWNPELLVLMVEKNQWGISEAAGVMYRSGVPISLLISDFIATDDKEKQSNLRSMVAYGIDRKVYCPVLVGDGLRGAVSFAGTRAPVQPNEIAELFLVAANAFAKAIEMRSDEQPDTPLNSRDLRILGLLAIGLTADAVGEEVGITKHTVTFHSTNIMRKLGAKNKAHAVAIALANGWLSADAISA